MHLVSGMGHILAGKHMIGRDNIGELATCDGWLSVEQ